MRRLGRGLGKCERVKRTTKGAYIVIHGWIENDSKHVLLPPPPPPPPPASERYCAELKCQLEQANRARSVLTEELSSAQSELAGARAQLRQCQEERERGEQRRKKHNVSLVGGQWSACACACVLHGAGWYCLNHPLIQPLPTVHAVLMLCVLRWQLNNAAQHAVLMLCSCWYWCGSGCAPAVQLLVLVAAATCCAHAVQLLVLVW